MHSGSVAAWQHDHVFLGAKHDRHERRTWFVVALTAVMMVAEIVGGTIYGSMALVADGWHMSTHAAALSISALAYRFARRHARDPRFSLGTGKLGELAGFSSAIILGLVALFIGYEAASRLLAPVPIAFDQAVMIAIVGLAVNLVSAWLLFDKDHHHQHDDGRGHRAHDHHRRGHHPGRAAHSHHQVAHGHVHDHNIRSAYLHVLADAMTSVLAIAGLLAGRFHGWIWMDPLMALVGAAVIAHWSWGLVRSSGAVLLDAVPDSRLVDRVRERIEVDGDVICDLHLWRLGPGHLAVIVAVVSAAPQAPSVYKARLEGIPGLSHVTVEVHPCPGHGPLKQAA
jgi:cation diffusion facilitator family transporter